jgi:hypothetical protein
LAGNAPSCIPEVACGTPNANPTINVKLEWTNPLVSATVISSTGSPTTISSIGHGLTNGDEVVLSGFNTECSVNAKWTVTVVDVDTFTIPANVTNIIDGVGVFSLVDTKSFAGCTFTNGETKEVYSTSYTDTENPPFCSNRWGRGAGGDGIGFWNKSTPPYYTTTYGFGKSDTATVHVNLGSATFLAFRKDPTSIYTGLSIVSSNMSTIQATAILDQCPLANAQLTGNCTTTSGITVTWSPGNGW